MSTDSSPGTEKFRHGQVISPAYGLVQCGNFAVHSQQNADGAHKNSVELNIWYSVTEPKCLAVVEVVKHFQVYLNGGMFTIYTNHSSFKCLDCMKDENGRMVCWVMSLQTYLYTVVH